MDAVGLSREVIPDIASLIRATLATILRFLRGESEFLPAAADAARIRHRFAGHDRAKADRLQLVQAILPPGLVDPRLSVEGGARSAHWIV